MRFITTGILVMAICCISYKTKAQDTLYWEPGKALTWNDFEAAPNFSFLFRMLSVTGIKYTYRLKKQTVQYDVSAFFLRHRSWKKHITDSTLLQHEQLHFDITELYARKLQQRLQQLPATDPNLHQKIENIAAEVIEEKNNLQRRYDKETSFGSVHRVQRKWEAAIQKALESLGGVKAW